MSKINLKSKFELFQDLWSPKVIAELNDYQFKLVRVKGDFVWHKHDETDEAFLVLEERRLTELSRYSKKLALIQRKIDLEIERET